MKILFIGDIVGKSGRATVKELLPSLLKEHSFDLVIANGENVTHGKGINEAHYHELLSYGIDVITLGNHAFSKAEIYKFIDKADRLIRPYNILPQEYGRGYLELEVCGVPVVVLNLCGSVFMENVIETPFIAMTKLLPEFKDKIVIVDIHAEATSEKIAFAHQFKYTCSAVLGTHTHVQTADERLIGSCAFISDVGMTGPYNSIIGRDITEVLDKFKGFNVKTYTVSEDKAQFCAVILDIDESNRKARSITRLQIRP
jgi:2',3'-cyclic-nucleotide 2'-phosphodiesterase